MLNRRYLPPLLRVWLALCLVVVPVLPSLASASMPMPSAVVADSDAHAGHAMHGEQGNTGSGCQTQHNCHGLCCAGCMHCAGISTVPRDLFSFFPPVLTPREVRLFSFVYPPLRERPPRLLSV